MLAHSSHLTLTMDGIVHDIDRTDGRLGLWVHDVLKTFVVRDDCPIHLDGQKKALRDVQPGDRVRITGVPADGMLHAQRMTVDGSRRRSPRVAG